MRSRFDLEMLLLLPVKIKRNMVAWARISHARATIPGPESAVRRFAIGVLHLRRVCCQPLDDLAGHKMPTFVLPLFAQRIMPLYIPLSASRPSRRRFLKRKFEGQHPAGSAGIAARLDEVLGRSSKTPSPCLAKRSRQLPR